ncbi:ankyrin repeat and LEM domain-containing protein 1-like isoform X2 [Pomacea canaliculata]|uniref:ankyrin repeat and LEM domain-containing protein 1-like isoform X2 n=1 Tax=Pomacea canaliculata TaxID=400727 RepID=UPI000D736825|nr:ankyrin repeat and LEM domain-containing protein 1-like isoform X2 [Pomacea canaliculata]
MTSMNDALCVLLLLPSVVRTFLVWLIASDISDTGHFFSISGDNKCVPMEQNRPSQEHLRDNFEESGNRELENDSNNCYAFIDLTRDSDNEDLPMEEDDDEVVCPEDELRNAKRRLVETFLKQEAASKEPEQKLEEAQSAGYSTELNRLLSGSLDLTVLEAEELLMKTQFESLSTTDELQSPKFKSKSCFCYLLLDPRITQNLPSRTELLSDLEGFKTFLLAIFYVGKGQQSRPFNHLRDALSQQDTPEQEVSKKIQRIQDVWASDRGIIMLYCFQNLIHDEACAREACMINAIGLQQLTNQIQGSYSIMETKTREQKCEMGAYLLYKAYKMFLLEGEKEISCNDMKQKMKKAIGPQKLEHECSKNTQ